MQTLLIWSTFEEQPQFFLIPDAPEWLGRCHRKIGGTVGVTEEEEALLMGISDALCANPEWCSGKNPDLNGAWVNFQLEDHENEAPILASDPIRIVSTGFAP